MFGRNLGKTEGSRGPPGVGFKVTADGHYDMENKKLCNVAEPQQPIDVVNLETLRNIIKIEIRGLFDITTRLRTSLDEWNIVVENSVKLPWQDISSGDEYMKVYLSQYDSLVVLDDILYREWTSSNFKTKVLQLVFSIN